MGLAQLISLANIEELSLDDTMVSDTGMVLLQSLDRLKTLYLRNTRVTDAGVKSLENKQKNLRVYQARRKRNAPNRAVPF